MDEAFGVETDEAVPISIFSVVSSQDKTRIYVDQKNNGYTFTSANFSGADSVFELDRGGVITFNNTVAPYYVIVPGGSGQLVSGAFQRQASTEETTFSVREDHSASSGK